MALPALFALIACVDASHTHELSRTHARLAMSVRARSLALPSLQALRGGSDHHAAGEVALTFSIECPTTMVDETVAVVGSVSELGDWTNFIPMSPKVQLCVLARFRNTSPGPHFAPRQVGCGRCRR